VFAAPLHRLVDIAEGFLIDDVPIVVFAPDPVIHGQARVVEAPIGDELKVVLHESLVAVLEGITAL